VDHHPTEKETTDDLDLEDHVAKEEKSALEHPGKNLSSQATITDHETEPNENKSLSEQNDVIHQEAFDDNTTDNVSKDILDVDTETTGAISDKDKIADKTVTLEEEHRESHSLKIDVKNSSNEFENNKKYTKKSMKIRLA